MEFMDLIVAGERGCDFVRNVIDLLLEFDPDIGVVIEKHNMSAILRILYSDGTEAIVAGNLEALKCKYFAGEIIFDEIINGRRVRRCTVGSPKKIVREILDRLFRVTYALKNLNL